MTIEQAEAEIARLQGEIAALTASVEEARRQALIQIAGVNAKAQRLEDENERLRSQLRTAE